MQMQAGLPLRDQSRRRLKILYIQPGTSSFAGIERVVDNVCTMLADRFAEDFEVDVLYTSVQKNRPTQSRGYKVIDRVAHGRLELMRIFRSVIKAKDYGLIVVPQIEPAVICMAACIGLKRRFALHLHGNPKREAGHLKAKILFFLMRVYFLSRVSYVFGTSPRQLESFKEMFNSKTPQAWVPNPVRSFDLSEALSSLEATGIVTFVNVGRFAFQKGQDILLQAFSELIKIRPNVRLRIVGYGSGEADLRAEITRLSLDEAVSIEHYPISPHPALATSDIYVSTSRWEGWSLAICEALRFGLPVISTDCEFGPSDILVDDRLGRLVPVSGGAALVEAMAYYCDNLVLERSHSEYRKTFIDRYSPERVVEIHAQAIRSAARELA
ncbi:glycosyltransferase involved in cell wall biosynthesis [Rhizobium mesoamericanum]|uniref:glycosyltransferase n=1 Tax=Rhizobium mesoamericanum TaxID=1079800 RepID=UPI002784DB7E|nr:glycosyltransferase [Rhizobium mesoamericanum]MDQ0562015.1 glycosyltransferase involved in cell wall biosynthesis [Rhizobium mesoamericanum]